MNDAATAHRTRSQFNERTRWTNRQPATAHFTRVPAARDQEIVTGKSMDRSVSYVAPRPLPLADSK